VKYTRKWKTPERKREATEPGATEVRIPVKITCISGGWRGEVVHMGYSQKEISTIALNP
jgi:hypothetical protein